MVYFNNLIVSASITLILAHTVLGERFCLGESDPEGVLYEGKLTRTKSRKLCQNWDSDEPHNRTHWPEDPSKHANYCRNPEKFGKRPWCYTQNPNKRWEYCDVRICPGLCGIQANGPPTFSSQRFKIFNGTVIRRKRVKRIIGGDIAAHGNWPWMVYVILSGNTCCGCGGTLIKRSWVLTAAHCNYYVYGKKYISVTAGHHVGSEQHKQERKVKRYIKHSGFDTGRNDIALIELDAPFVINNYVRLACLPPPEYIVPTTTYCVGTGWGFRRDNRRGLKQVVLPVRSYDACRKVLGRRMKDKNKMCAGWKGNGHDTCRGDSGGPLMCLQGNGNKARWTVQGVTSWSFTTCNDAKGGYGAYTRVSKYMRWISRKIGEPRGA